jgi:hypothetical protein
MKISLKFFVLIFLLFSCKQNQSNLSQKKEKLDYQALGRDIVTQSQATILSHLSFAIQNQGIPAAIEYCNANISHLIDSLSKVHHCNIRRTSLKLRNIANSPRNEDEVFVLQQFHENYVKNKRLDPRLVETDGKFIYYQPIVIMMNTCLKCHGELKKDIPTEVEKKINRLYPNDQATGYKLNDFRGMWVVEFE